MPWAKTVDLPQIHQNPKMHYIQLYKYNMTIPGEPNLWWSPTPCWATLSRPSCCSSVLFGHEDPLAWGKRPVGPTDPACWLDWRTALLSSARTVAVAEGTKPRATDSPINLHPTHANRAHKSHRLIRFVIILVHSCWVRVPVFSSSVICLAYVSHCYLHLCTIHNVQNHRATGQIP